MLRVLIALILAAVTALGLAWFADRPGSFTIEWLDYRVQTTLFIAVVLTALGVVALTYLASVLRKLVRSPGRIRRRMAERRQTRGLVALRKGIFAVGAGDEALAARFAAEARRALPYEPLTQLLLAQSAQLSGDRRAAQRLFEAMSEKPETQLLGLRGLFLEASRDGQMEAAEQFAARAMALNPALPWPVHALFEMQCRTRNWEGALDTLNVARNFRHVDRKTADRRRAVLLTAQAMEMDGSQPDKAAELALEAHRLAPGFVPASCIAGRILASRDSAHKAARVLARTWQYTPHPDLALAYAYVRPGDSPRDRLARIKSLIFLTPDHEEAQIAFARAAADAREWEEARDALQPLLAKTPSARVCTLMARIEGGERRDAGRVREWLARAVRAPRDPAWMADGVASSEWAPISPVTGTLDAFEWRVPGDRRVPGADDALMDDISSLSRELEGVARADTVTETAVEGNGQPITITVTPLEPANAPKPPAEKVPDVVLTAGGETPSPAPAADTDDQTARAAETALPTTETSPPKPRKVETRIFVPDRPPDDPGPGRVDEDEASTPIGRFRSASK